MKVAASFFFHSWIWTHEAFLRLRSSLVRVCYGTSQRPVAMYDRQTTCYLSSTSSTYLTGLPYLNTKEIQWASEARKKNTTPSPSSPVWKRDNIELYIQVVLDFFHQQYGSHLLRLKCCKDLGWSFQVKIASRILIGCLPHGEIQQQRAIMERYKRSGKSKGHGHDTVGRLCIDSELPMFSIPIAFHI